VFDADARSHALVKQVAALEEQLMHSRSRPSSRLGQQQQRAFSPLRPRSNSDLRRSSFGSHRPASVVPPLARAVFEQGMSAETRHKRLISLSMLKARIDSEVQTAVGGTSRPSSRASSVRGLSPVRSASGREGEGSGSEYMHVHGHVGHKPQFLDDSHVFWCHSCSGDLVIL
jgi:hypothetical protein